ncbi:MAG: hypothetical protein MUC59_08360 [Saprospiraceae bacterium]|jgi:hypothetical protein|nr:hypothetical protein [Saprospiraceae bacterium]
MLTIEAEAQISKKDRRLSIHVAESVPNGDYDLLVVLMPKQQARSKKKSGAKPKAIWYPTYQVPVNPTLTFNRSEIYGDDGR